MKSFEKTIFKIFGIMALSGIFFISQSQTLRGIVIDTDGKPISGAHVKLVKADLSASSGHDGTWKLEVPTNIIRNINRKLIPEPVLKGNTLCFLVNDKSQYIKLSIFSLDGKLICNAIDQNLAEGSYIFNPLKKPLNANIYVAKLQIGNEINHFKLPVLNRTSGFALQKARNTPLPEGLHKQMAVMDTLKVIKSGYTAVAIPITNYDDSITVTLETFIPEYHLNPPSQCHNRFFVKDCIPGDPNSACGGNCRVANSCSPPEDASKADLPKTFICPRFMLFSTEMLQAAIDDASLYGWGDESPFNYAVVGHDPDVGGVDDTTSSCCQCYQLIFVKPEPSSPQPPELPYPKPLIVQSFNTAASGPKGFDVFMGAGGYGAFNSCYKDPNFTNTTTFDEFLYKEYPYQNPGSGGISFLRYDECKEGWPPTTDPVRSEKCQNKIEQMCNQAVATGSDQITEDTRRSCIETNKVESLYHQNWEVMVKRVRCPDNLTRVTGCRLKEEHLPLPLPDVKTPQDAQKNGSFKDGYHTTTMQDCCKPTCAWADWVVNYNLPVDGEWNSFYSCDKYGVPITK